MLAAAIVIGASHLVPTALELTGPAIVVWKGAGVALLALYALLRARSVDAVLLAVATWAMYFLGQVMIVLGVARVLARESGH